MKSNFRIKPEELKNENNIDLWLDENEYFLNLFAADGKGGVFQIFAINKRDSVIEIYYSELDKIGLGIKDIKQPLFKIKSGRGLNNNRAGNLSF